MNNYEIDNLLEHVDSINQILNMHLDTDKCGSNVHLIGEDICVTIKTNSGPAFLLPGLRANSDWIVAHREWKRIFCHETRRTLLPWLKEERQETWLREEIDIIKNVTAKECGLQGAITITPEPI